MSVFTKEKSLAGEVSMTANVTLEDQLVTAALHGQLTEVESLLATGIDPNSVRQDGWSAIGAAAGHGSVDIIRTLLDQGADPNGYGHESALNLACFYGQVESAKILVDHGADLNTIDAHGFTPLMNTIFYYHQALARRYDLIQSNWDLTTDRMTLLEHLGEALVLLEDVRSAWDLKNMFTAPGAELVWYLLLAGANNRGTRDTTSLLADWVSSFSPMTGYVLEVMASSDEFWDSSNDIPPETLLFPKEELLTSAESEETTLLAISAAIGADRSLIDSLGNQAVNLACQLKNYELAQCLVEMGAPYQGEKICGRTINLLSNVGKKVIAKATEMKRTVKTEAQNENRPTADRLDADQKTTFGDANNMTEVLCPECGPQYGTKLLPFASSCNRCGSKFYPQLVQAVYDDYLDTVKQLLWSGIDPNSMDYYGNTPLGTAISQCNDERYFQYLIEHGAKIDSQEPGDGDPYPLLAIASQCVHVVKAVLTAFIQDEKSLERAQHWFIENTLGVKSENSGETFNPKSLDFMINSGWFSWDTTDFYGRTLLTGAASFREWSFVKDLIQFHGANVNSRDKNRESPLTIAIDQHDIKAMSILVKLGAKLTDREFRLAERNVAGPQKVMNWLIKKSEYTDYLSHKQEVRLRRQGPKIPKSKAQQGVTKGE